MPEIEIIDTPKLKSFLRDTTEWSFTTLAWAVWLYLLLPLLNVVLWLLGFRYFYMEIFKNAGYEQLLTLLGKMGWAVLIVFLTLRLWGYYNYMRFGKKDRRKAAPPATAKQLSEFFHVPPEQIAELQSRKEVVWPRQKDSDQDVAAWLAKSEK